MKNIYLFSKIFIYFLLIITFVSNFIYWFYPDQYLGYISGYDYDLIENFRNPPGGNFTQIEYEKICKKIDPNIVMQAYGKISDISLTLIIFSFIIILVFGLKCNFNKNNPAINPNIIRNFMVILFASFAMYVFAILMEGDLDFLNMCG